MSHPDDHPSRAELSADAHKEGIEAAADAIYARFVEAREKHWPETSYSDLAQVAVNAYLEALNVH